MTDESQEEKGTESNESSQSQSQSQSQEEEKKERVLHTRVSPSLDEELRGRAQALGISVSNLVRNALTHTFGLVGDVLADGAGVARSATEGKAPRPAGVPASAAPAAPAPILGWQVLVLNLNAICERCNAILPKATQAALAVTTQGIDPQTIRCLDCVGVVDEEGEGGDDGDE